MAVKPFKLNLKKSEKEKSKIELPREVNGRLIAECTPNIGGQWGYKGDDFLMKILWATGYIDSASHKWLVGSIDNWNDLFDIHHKKIEGKDERGFPKSSPNPEEESITKQWQEQGQLVALCVDTIPQLEWLVEFAQNKIIFNHTGYSVFLKSSPKKETFDTVSSAIAEAQDSSFEFNLMKHGRDPVFKEFKSTNSWFYIACEEDLYDDNDTMSYMKLDKVLDELVLLEFNEGLLDKVKLEGYSTPEVKISSGGSFGGGSKGQPESEVLADRQAYVLKELGVTSLGEIAEQYGRKLCPIHVDIVMSLASQSNWTNAHYTLTNAWSNLNENASSVGEKGAAQNGSREVTEREDAPTTNKAPDVSEQNGKVKVSEDENLPLPKILDLLDDETRSFPAEINVEFLRNQPDDWLELFLDFITGAIITSKGNQTPFAKGTTRSINTWVKLRVPESQGISSLSTEQLESLIAHRDFIQPGTSTPVG